MISSHSEPKFDTVIIRFAGEIGIKGAWTRKLYERRLVNNIKAVLKHYEIDHACLDRTFGRIYLKTGDAHSVSQKLTKVFGVSSLSSAVETTSKMDDIVDVSVRIAGFRFEKDHSFAVRCRRIGQHSFTSQEVCRQVGRRILDAYPQLGLRVDLKHPDGILGVEVRDNRAFIFADSIKGAGGLPLGTQPKLVCLLTDDSNSAVACWLTMRRGCPSVLVHLDNSPFIKKGRVGLVSRHSHALSEWAIGFPRRLRTISNSQNLAKIVAKCPKELTNLICKRLMFRIAERIAESEKAEGIVTGETLSDKLTLHDFRVEDEVVKRYPVYRPLQGFDDSEIVGLKKKLGIREGVIRRTSAHDKVSRRQRCVGNINLKNVKRLEEKMLEVDKMVEASFSSLLNKGF